MRIVLITEVLHISLFLLKINLIPGKSPLILKKGAFVPIFPMRFIFYINFITQSKNVKNEFTANVILQYGCFNWYSHAQRKYKSA